MFAKTDPFECKASVLDIRYYIFTEKIERIIYNIKRRAFSFHIISSHTDNHFEFSSFQY
jgi:hypothetical protein